MEKKISRRKTSYRNIFKKINLIKENQILHTRRDVRTRLNKISNKFDILMKYIDNTFLDESSKKKYSKNNNYLTILNKKKNLTQKFDSDYSSKPVSETRSNKINFSLAMSKNKNVTKNKNKMNEKNYIIFGFKNNKEINNYTRRSCLTLRKGSGLLKSSSSSILDESKKDSIKDTMKDSIFFKNRNDRDISSSQPNINIIKKNSKKIISQIETIPNIIYAYDDKENKNKKINLNKIKNLSFSLNNKNNKNYFSHYKGTLKPDILLKFLNYSKEVEKSFKDNLEVNMNKKTKKLLKIAKNEIKLKDPNYNQKNVFRNILQVKKTIKQAKRMRNENKIKVKYSGPGNINNEIYIRKKNGNLLRFFEMISQMKDDNFYTYRKVLNDFYPTLSQKAIKEKYQPQEKNVINNFDIYESKCNENSLKINQLLTFIQK